ncbi:MAG: AEC family transporter [Desulfobacterales bacterium]
MSAAATIAPIFFVIALGWAARRRGFFPEPFIVAANRLVYYMAIPAMVFRSIAGASLQGDFDFRVPAVTLAVVLAAFFAAWGWAGVSGIQRRRRGTFLQCSVHGNLGYIALAVAYYALGQEGLARAGLIAGFVMILQNLLSVAALQVHGPDGGGRIGSALAKIFANPVILSAGAGIAFSLTGLSIPRIIDRSLNIVGDLALPMALLIIGASLSFQRMRHRPMEVLSACLFKLAILPAAGLLVFDLLRLPLRDGIPALILLAAPTATVSYVMSREMQGDPDFAGVVISASTLLSAGTYVLWLHLAL